MSAEAFCRLAAHSYIVGYSALNLEITTTCPTPVPIMRSCQKVGDYFRCAARLYRSITQSPKSRQSFAQLRVVPVSPPSPQAHTIDPNYWHVLECVWWREKGTFLPVTRVQFLSSYQKSMKKYGTWENQEFNQHAEITLISGLVELHRKTPTVIGVSKNCCGLCTAFIEGVNKYKGDGLKWSSPSSHGNRYNVSLPNVQETSLLRGLDAMKEYICERVIVRIIQGCVPDNTTETPPYCSDANSDYSPIASTYSLLEQRDPK